MALSLTGPRTANVGDPAPFVVRNLANNVGQSARGRQRHLGRQRHRLRHLHPGRQLLPQGHQARDDPLQQRRGLRAQRQRRHLRLPAGPRRHPARRRAARARPAPGARARLHGRPHRPIATIDRLRNRQHFARGKGPRELRGTVSDDGAIKRVQLRLSRKHHRRCWVFDGDRERFKRRSCRRDAAWFSVGDSADWSYLLPLAAALGLYQLQVRATPTWPAMSDIDPEPALPCPLGAWVASPALIAGVVALAAAPAAARAATSTQRAVVYLERAQNADGGFGFAPGDRDHRDRHLVEQPWGCGPLSPLAGARAPAGRAVAGRGGVAHRARGARPVEHRPGGPRPARVAHTPRTLAGRLARAQSSNGSFSGLVTTTAFGLLALRAAGRSTHDRGVRRAASWLAGQAEPRRRLQLGRARRRQRHRRDRRRHPGAGARRALARLAGVRRAVRFVRAHQGTDGGFPLQPGDASNAQSTAWAVQGLVAGGVNPGRVGRRGSRDPLAYLRSLQAANGAIRYSRSSAQTPVWVTAAGCCWRWAAGVLAPSARRWRTRRAARRRARRR